MIFFLKLFKSFVKLSSQGYQVSEKRKNRNERKKKATLIIWVGHKRWPVTFTPVKLLIKMEICFLCWQECDPWLWLISSFSSFEKTNKLFFCGAEHGFSVGSGSGFFLFIYIFVENPMFCSSSCSMLPLHTELLLITNTPLCLCYHWAAKIFPEVSPFWKHTLKGILFYLGGGTLLFWIYKRK